MKVYVLMGYDEKESGGVVGVFSSLEMALRYDPSIEWRMRMHESQWTSFAPTLAEGRRSGGDFHDLWIEEQPLDPAPKSEA